jgi:hypothetical protein
MRERIIKRLRELIAITNARATEYTPSGDDDGLDAMSDQELHVYYENTLARELTHGVAPLGGRPVVLPGSSES